MTGGMMNSQHLEYFCKVAEFGSFSRAAIFLGINQSALSRHVRNLERDLGIQLFYRNGRGVVLTEFGERLLARAARACHACIRWGEGHTGTIPNPPSHKLAPE